MFNLLIVSWCWPRISNRHQDAPPQTNRCEFRRVKLQTASPSSKGLSIGYNSLVNMLRRIVCKTEALTLIDPSFCIKYPTDMSVLVEPGCYWWRRPHSGCRGWAPIVAWVLRDPDWRHVSYHLWIDPMLWICWTQRRRSVSRWSVWSRKRRSDGLPTSTAQKAFQRVYTKAEQLTVH